MVRRGRNRLAACWLALPALLMAGTAHAASPASAAPAQPVVAAPPLAVPPAPVLLALLRGTLSAVNQANITGNYSVLRDLGAPSFREAYSTAVLAESFRSWRERKLDFAAILLLDAKLSRPPVVGPNGALRLTGYFPTAPLMVEFDLTFHPVAGNWRLAAIAVSANEPEITGSIGTVPARAAPAAKPAIPVFEPPAYQGPMPQLLTPPGDRPRI